VTRMAIDEARRTYPREMQAIDARAAELRGATGSDFTPLYARVDSDDGRAILVVATACELEQTGTLALRTPIRPSLRVVN
jgi:hypothetical protein